jgi:hypothetical protein
VAGNWRRLDNEDHHNLYPLLTTIRVIGWVKHVTRMGQMINTIYLSGNLKGRDNMEDLVVNWRIILERI